MTAITDVVGSSIPVSDGDAVDSASVVLATANVFVDVTGAAVVEAPAGLSRVMVNVVFASEIVATVWVARFGHNARPKATAPVGRGQHE